MTSEGPSADRGRGDGDPHRAAGAAPLVDRRRGRPRWSVYGADDVPRWLSPAMERVPDVTAMSDAPAGLGRPGPTPLPRAGGRSSWPRPASSSAASRCCRCPRTGEDLEVAWQLAPHAWGRGWPPRPGARSPSTPSPRASTSCSPWSARRTAGPRPRPLRAGMEWVGETEKYYDLRLQVYRLRKGDLDVPDQRRPVVLGRPAEVRPRRPRPRRTRCWLERPPVRWLSKSTTCAATVPKQDLTCPVNSCVRRVVGPEREDPSVAKAAAHRASPGTV